MAASTTEVPRVTRSPVVSRMEAGAAVSLVFGVSSMCATRMSRAIYIKCLRFYPIYLIINFHRAQTEISNILYLTCHGGYVVLLMVYCIQKHYLYYNPTSEQSGREQEIGSWVIYLDIMFKKLFHIFEFRVWSPKRYTNYVTAVIS